MIRRYGLVLCMILLTGCAAKPTQVRSTVCRLGASACAPDLMVSGTPLSSVEYLTQEFAEKLEPVNLRLFYVEARNGKRWLTCPASPEALEPIDRYNERLEEAVAELFAAPEASGQSTDFFVHIISAATRQAGHEIKPTIHDIQEDVVLIDWTSPSCTNPHYAYLQPSNGLFVIERTGTLHYIGWAGTVKQVFPVNDVWIVQTQSGGYMSKHGEVWFVNSNDNSWETQVLLQDSDEEGTVEIDDVNVGDFSVSIYYIRMFASPPPCKLKQQFSTRYDHTHYYSAGVTYQYADNTYTLERKSTDKAVVWFQDGAFTEDWQSLCM